MPLHWDSPTNKSLKGDGVENLVNEIYEVLVSRFGVKEICIPAFSRTKRKATSWKEFITYVVIDGLKSEELATKCGYSGSSKLSQYLTGHYEKLTSEKGNTYYITFFLFLIGKKKCSKCGEIKPLKEFNNSAQQYHGLNPSCKLCSREDSNIRYYENHEASLGYARKYYQANKEKVKEEVRSYYKIHKESILVEAKKYRQENKPLIAYHAAKRRADLLLATPNWADKEKIKQMYKQRPEGYHVDHIIPLHHANVCGLHCEFNLQYLIASENLSKCNRFEVC